MTIRLRGGAILVACLLAATGGALAGSLEIDVNDDAVRGTLAWNVLSARLRLDAGWLHHQDDGDVGHLGFHVAGPLSSGAVFVEGGLGGRAIAVDTDLEDGAGLALGGFARYRLANAPRVELGGELYFAPDSLTGDDLEDYLEGAIRIAYRLLDRADVHVGYRFVEAEFAGGFDAEVDDGLHVGIRLEF